MIKHVVMWTVNATANQDKKEVLEQIRTRLNSLVGKIGGLTSLQVGINKNDSLGAYDICLITEHTSWQDLQNYQEHPLHKEVAVFVGQVKKSRAVVDFEF
jgi:hypothetical protein